VPGGTSTLRLGGGVPRGGDRGLVKQITHGFFGQSCISRFPVLRARFPRLSITSIIFIFSPMFKIFTFLLCKKLSIPFILGESVGFVEYIFPTL
jgi:hypothetical protein